MYTPLFLIIYFLYLIQNIDCIYNLLLYTQLLNSNTGICRGMPIFLFLIKNIDCGYMYAQSMF